MGRYFRFAFTAWKILSVRKGPGSVIGWLRSYDVEWWIEVEISIHRLLFLLFIFPFKKKVQVTMQRWLVVCFTKKKIPCSSCVPSPAAMALHWSWLDRYTHSHSTLLRFFYGLQTLRWLSSSTWILTDHRRSRGREGGRKREDGGQLWAIAAY